MKFGCGVPARQSNAQCKGLDVAGKLSTTLPSSQVFDYSAKSPHRCYVSKLFDLVVMASGEDEKFAKKKN